MATIAHTCSMPVLRRLPSPQRCVQRVGRKAVCAQASFFERLDTDKTRKGRSARMAERGLDSKAVGQERTQTIATSLGQVLVQSEATGRWVSGCLSRWKLWNSDIDTVYARALFACGYANNERIVVYALQSLPTMFPPNLPEGSQDWQVLDWTYQDVLKAQGDRVWNPNMKSVMQTIIRYHLGASYWVVLKKDYHQDLSETLLQKWLK